MKISFPLANALVGPNRYVGNLIRVPKFFAAVLITLISCNAFAQYNQPVSFNNSVSFNLSAIGGVAPVPGQVFTCIDTAGHGYWATHNHGGWIYNNNNLIMSNPMLNVGIGTTTPAYPLHVVGNFADSTTMFKLYNITDPLNPYASACGVQYTPSDSITGIMAFSTQAQSPPRPHKLYLEFNNVYNQNSVFFHEGFNPEVGGMYWNLQLGGLNTAVNPTSAINFEINLSNTQGYVFQFLGNTLDSNYLVAYNTTVNGASHNFGGITNQGKYIIKDGTQGAGKILTSDATGTASWQSPYVAGNGLTLSGNNINLGGKLSATSTKVRFPQPSGGNLDLVMGDSAITANGISFGAGVGFADNFGMVNGIYNIAPLGGNVSTVIIGRPTGNKIVIDSTRMVITTSHAAYNFDDVGIKLKADTTLAYVLADSAATANGQVLSYNSFSRCMTPQNLAVVLAAAYATLPQYPNDHDAGNAGLTTGMPYINTSNNALSFKR